MCSLSSSFCFAEKAPDFLVEHVRLGQGVSYIYSKGQMTYSLKRLAFELYPRIRELSRLTDIILNKSQLNDSQLTIKVITSISDSSFHH